MYDTYGARVRHARLPAPGTGRGRRHWSRARPVSGHGVDEVGLMGW